ncbi:MAG: YdeI/OmpD-associated family protein [Bacteroidota bacterium]
MPSTTAQKFKIKEGDILLTLHAPAEFKKKLGPVPAGVKIITEEKMCSQVHWFATSKAQVEKETKKILSLVKDNVICWIYFPKGASKIQTDLTRDKGWESLQAHSDILTWISLVAFDETWSAFGFRLKNAADKLKKAVPAERPILQYIDAGAKTIRLPEDLALAFKKNKPANDFFNGLSFTNRKEYVEWIVTAKQEATRKERIAGTMDRLAKQWKNPRNL